MSWEEFKRRGVYKFEFAQPLVAFREQIEQGKPFKTPSGKIEIFSTTLAKVTDWTKTQYGYPIPAIPKWIEPFESLNHPLAKIYPFHMITPHPRWRTHSIFHNIPWLRETYQQEITLNASDAKRLGIRTGDIVEVWNGRGKDRAAGLRHRALHAGRGGGARGRLDGPRQGGRRPRRQPGFPDPGRALAGRGLRLQHHPVQREEDRTGASPGWDEPGHGALARFPARLLTWPRNSTRRKSRRPSSARWRRPIEPVKPKKQLGFIHHNVDCIGCRACEIACKDKNGLPAGPRFRRVMYVEGGAYPDVYAYKVNMSCNHCAEPACLPTCPTGAIWKRATTAWSTSTRRCASAAAAARRPVPTARRSGTRRSRSSRSATCASTRLEAGRKPYCVMACMMRVLDIGPIDEAVRRHLEDDRAGAGREAAAAPVRPGEEHGRIPS
jgi:Fe-S-cluster-containing dehydrogenase component